MACSPLHSRAVSATALALCITTLALALLLLVKLTNVPHSAAGPAAAPNPVDDPCTHSLPLVATQKQEAWPAGGQATGKQELRPNEKAAMVIIRHTAAGDEERQIRRQLGGGGGVVPVKKMDVAAEAAAAAARSSWRRRRREGRCAEGLEEKDEGEYCSASAAVHEQQQQQLGEAGVAALGMNMKKCRGRCVDVCVDGANCGSCGYVCPFMLSCCRGHCLDLASDPLNCGHCGHSCLPADSLSCHFGLCNYY